MMCSECNYMSQGMELYPRIGKNFDIKVFTNCRFGMMSWAVLAVTYCIKQVLVNLWSCKLHIFSFGFCIFNNFAASPLAWFASYNLLNQYELNGRVSDSMLVNTTLMLVYVTKFFWWEAGYWSTMDIAHDRGIYIYMHLDLVSIAKKTLHRIWYKKDKDLHQLIK